MRDRLGDVRLEAPDGRIVSVLGQQAGERRAPGAGAHHRALHTASPEFERPKRCSVPSRSRLILARCDQKTKMHTRTATIVIGDRTPWNQTSSAGSTPAPVSEPADT